MTRSAKRPGFFFERITGVQPDACEDLLDIEQRVADSYGRQLDVQPFNAALIAEHGNVFSVSRYSEDIEEAIDSELERMTRATARG